MSVSHIRVSIETKGNSDLIVTEEEIVKAIQNKAPNTVILHKVGPAGENVTSGYCFKMLIGTDDSNMY